MAEYARGVLARLTDLGRDLKPGSWRPGPVYAMEIAKPARPVAGDGTMRPLRDPARDDADDDG
ncbi:hypothetical protein BFF78_08555 [Streptomyces fodineus]|uniref:Uncharacterized protein n=1 Tax=Streptomyces fodineus TaxID=1904616 RepID=A0A1D7Y6E5_9ACTN|nr:hypothetical protein [Streptomyces fodineus]AOR31086.1 hypothetical protein BFF78_08555 [Streptomyces fodineus]